MTDPDSTKKNLEDRQFLRPASLHFQNYACVLRSVDFRLISTYIAYHYVVLGEANTFGWPLSSSYRVYVCVNPSLRVTSASL